MRILIAEDQPLAPSIWAARSRKWDMKSRSRADGELAWNQVQSGELPVLISDWMMPRLDGPELCRRIRAAGERPIYVYYSAHVTRQA